MINHVTLYRPVGTEELKLIEDSNFRAFPPRLPEQPIFYPVTNEEYAIQIARDWNVKYNSDHRGYVTKFAVNADYIAKFQKKIVVDLIAVLIFHLTEVTDCLAEKILLFHQQLYIFIHRK